jgi:hypothetical protein
MSTKKILLTLPLAAMLVAFDGNTTITKQDKGKAKPAKTKSVEEPFQYNTEQFADLRVLRYHLGSALQIQSYHS